MSIRGKTAPAIAKRFFLRKLKLCMPQYRRYNTDIKSLMQALL